MCPGVNSASKNEYRVNPGGKDGRCLRLTTYNLHVPMSRNMEALTSWNPVGLFRPVMGQFFLNNQMVLNLNKMHNLKCVSSNFLTFPLNTVYNNWTLSVTGNIKFLGMHMDGNLTWKSNIDNLIKKLVSICFMLRKLLHFVNVKMLHMVYFAHFYPQISQNTWNGNMFHVTVCFLC
jgi:hypothetical protein